MGFLLEGIMGVSSANAVSVQQLSAQSNAALSALRQNAKADEDLADVISEQSSPSGSRGQNLDVTV